MAKQSTERLSSICVIIYFAFLHTKIVSKLSTYIIKNILCIFKCLKKKTSFSSVQLLSHVWLFVTPWTAAHHSPLSTGFSGQESVQFSHSSCPTFCDTMDCSTPGLPVHHQFPEFTQTHAHWVGDAIQPSHPLSSPSPPALNLAQHQGLFQWVSSLHQVAKVLEFHLQHQSFQWIFRTYFL